MLKNKRKFIILFIVILILSLPTMVNAAKTATETTSTSTGSKVEWSYELSSEVITSLKCTNVAAITGSLIIPETIDGYKVTTLSSSAFQKCYGLSEITIPNGVVSIGNYCFDNCTGLKKVTIPEGVTTIGTGAFRGCTGLTSIKIPNTVTSLGESAFDGCLSLSNVNLSDNLTTIKKSTFADCTSLVEIVLPVNLTTILGDTFSFYAAFDGCSSLKWIKIQENVVSIDEDTFASCKNLTIYGKEGSYAQTFAESKNINFDKIENWDNRKEAQVAPKIKKITAKGGNNEYISGKWEYQVKTGDEVSVEIQFDKDIVLKESPKLTIKFGTGENRELTTGIVSSDTITYRYVVKSEDIGAIQIISLTGGDVTSNNGVQINNKLVNLDNQLVSINTKEEKIPVEIVELNKTTLSLEKGQTYTLTATVKPINATNKAVNYTSADEKIATVNSEGKITAISKGVTTITVTTEDGAKTATCKVTVTELSVEEPSSYINFPYIIFNGKGNISLKEYYKQGTYTLYYQFVETNKEVKEKLESLQGQYKNSEITLIEYSEKVNQLVNKYDETKWIKTEDGSFACDLTKFTGTKYFILWVKVVMENNTFYDCQMYSMDGVAEKEDNEVKQEQTNNDKKENNIVTENKTNTKDNTISKVELPQTGKIAGSIGITVVLIILIVLGYIKYKQYKEI